MAKASFRDLEVWQRSMDFAEACYRQTETFPTTERYGLTGQIRRAAASIPSNVAEGKCRQSVKAFAYHVSIALGSHGEIETCLELSCRLGFLPAARKDILLAEAATIGRLLNGLHRALERSPLLRNQ